MLTVHDERRDVFGVAFLCRVLGVSASAYYQRATGRHSPRQVEDQRLTALIHTIHEDNYEAYGYRRMWQGLVFFSFVLDVFGRRIVGWQLATHMRTSLVTDALRSHDGSTIDSAHRRNAQRAGAAQTNRPA